MNNKNTLLSATVDIEIPFHDCDPMQIVWHGNYARYLEVARCELLRKFDYDYLQMRDSGYDWPIVDMRIKYVGSASFTQCIRVEAYLKEYETRLKIDYVIFDSASNKRLTKAYTVQVAVDRATQEMQFVSPRIIGDKLAQVLS
ncbi:acyl-CoA thioesterase [Pseudoalteromonas sp. CNC9-20]|uniref:acyl-CoA thioesterase n=1 Tax=Pseudoalteromonas sp. CNC9-20 TaxID=2917750 RepID=UPI001EF54CF4|nr:thioesterase family protein [Pseudoalteromonas sp. CNC9-20]MCG7569307.1 acyl-CoA thioesterase [Pseudoalteromonas sp. CNC9-20]